MLLGVVALALAAIVVWRGVKKPARPKRVDTPHWPVPTDSEDADLYKAAELQAAGKLDEAVAAYTKLLDREPKSWLALGNRASCYEALGQDEKAIEDLERLAQTGLRNSNPWWRIARLQHKLGRHDAARVAAEKSIQIEPQLADPYLVLSDLQADKDLRKSIDLMEEYLQRAWKGSVRDEDERKKVEDKNSGIYVQRLIAQFRTSLPVGPDRDARAQMEAHWYAALKYVDFAPLWTTKYKTLDHLMSYLRLAKTLGDPDRARYAKAREMVPRLKAEIRKNEELPWEKTDAGGPDPLFP